MSKIKKIVFIIIICLACISIHNISLAATTWKDERHFSLDGTDCTNTKHKKWKCTVYTVGKKKVHIGVDGFIGNVKPRLNNKGVLCFQHDIKENAGDDDDDDDTKPNPLEVQYKVEINQNIVKITPISKAARAKSGEDAKEFNSIYSAQVAYILSHTSKTAGNNERRDNGTQGALWMIIPIFWSEIGGNMKFSEVADKMSTSWTSVANAKKIWNESKAYASYVNSKVNTAQVPTKITVSVLDKDYYRIGPFKMTFPSKSYGDIKFAGFESADLKIDGSDVKSGDWMLCDEKGDKLEPVSNNDFYIKVKKNKIGAEGSLKVNTKKMVTTADFYTMISADETQEQGVIADAEREYLPESVTFKFETFGNLRIAKKDADSGKALKGVEFTIKNSSGQYIQALDASKKVQASATGIITNIQFTKNEKKATKFLTNDKGIIELHNIPVDTYTINEMSVGKHYAYVLNKNNISWEANGKTSTGQSMSVRIKGQKPNSTDKMLKDEYVTIVTVKNKKQVGELDLIKV
ncbi:MAG: SpaA isopeptide-forming pilin-related protein, partial [bacterium]|nr:SpaA isopeptide-forming pilin-related protein [bacterium]